MIATPWLRNSIRWIGHCCLLFQPRIFNGILNWIEVDIATAALSLALFVAFVQVCVLPPLLFETPLLLKPFIDCLRMPLEKQRFFFDFLALILACLLFFVLSLTSPTEPLLLFIENLCSPAL